MAISEKSFRDRQGRGQQLHDIIVDFDVLFAPADASLAMPDFQVFLTGGLPNEPCVEQCNLAVETLSTGYTNAAQDRVSLVKSTRKFVTQAVSYVKSNKDWKARVKAVKTAADKLRGVRPPSRTPLPTPPVPGEPPADSEKKRNKGEQAYSELEAHLTSFITAITAVPGYLPPGPAIQISTFNGYLSQLRSLNRGISTVGSQLINSREDRRVLYYDGDSSFQGKFLAIKEAVKGQYGQSSANYRAVKGKKW